MTLRPSFLRTSSSKKVTCKSVMYPAFLSDMILRFVSSYNLSLNFTLGVA